ncbi:hypothetical protein HPP92_019690 [Vanilla planifolia]|uniref:Uncharacterized protein n=1 Tax=Vanilla planifolia TaxID=51239 RepID=A0A835Q3S0_VANPL|nr:hypothetical protein HPP92_019690 [Vanilla planifolia]
MGAVLFKTEEGIKESCTAANLANLSVRIWPRERRKRRRDGDVSSASYASSSGLIGLESSRWPTLQHSAATTIVSLCNCRIRRTEKEVVDHSVACADRARSYPVGELDQPANS